MVAHLSWAIWANRSQLLIWFEQNERMSEFPALQKVLSVQDGHHVSKQICVKKYIHSRIYIFSEITFWTFSKNVLYAILLFLAICWKAKFFNYKFNSTVAHAIAVTRVRNPESCQKKVGHRTNPIYTPTVLVPRHKRREKKILHLMIYILGTIFYDIHNSL